MNSAAVVSSAVQNLDSLAADGKDEQRRNEDLPARNGEAAEEDYNGTVAQDLAMSLDQVSRRQSGHNTGKFRFEIAIGGCSLYYFDGSEELDALKERLQQEMQGIVLRNLPGRISPAQLTNLLIRMNPVMVEFTNTPDSEPHWREGMRELWKAAWAEGCDAVAVAVRGHYRDGASHEHAWKTIEEILRELRELPEWGTSATRYRTGTENAL